jgi:hypothetical protein
VNHSVSAMSATATYSNIQPPGGSTEPHLIYSNIGNHANRELGNTYSNVSAFSAAGSMGKFCCYKWLNMFAIRLYSRDSVEICPRVVTRDTFRLGGTVIVSIETWIPPNYQVLGAFLVKWRGLSIKLVLHTHCTSALIDCLIYENCRQKDCNSA